jgi:hypothetical protein
MGYLHYASDPQGVRIPDHELAHLKAVAVTKLRRNESFTLSWVHQSDPPGRTTIWMQPSIPLRFEFDCAEPVPLDPALLRKIADEANSSRGVAIEAENAVDSNPVAAAHRTLVAV